MESYVIGVDSGGTSTVAEAYNQNGQRLKTTQTGFGNLLIDAEMAMKNIKQAVDSILEDLGKEQCKMIVFGIAGIEVGDGKQMILDAFAQYPSEIIVLNDAWLAYHAALKSEDGCLVISGTGSVAIGQNQGKEARVGGWGHLLGDEGSGYAIAKQLITRILQAEDDNRSLTPLQEKLLERVGVSTAIELSRFVYANSKDQVAKLTVFISQEAEQQNSEAIALLKDAGADLGKMAIQLVEKLGLDERVKIAVTGSVLTKNAIVYEQFKQIVLEGIKDCEFIKDNQSNTIGAYYYYQSHVLNTEEGVYE